MPIMNKRNEQFKNDENIRPRLLPPPPSGPEDPSSRYQPLSTHPIPPRNELLFHCQLSHGSSTKDIKNFSNVKELYMRIGEAFDIDPHSIIFCTLNTHKIDMTRLLGGQIGLDDFIFAHVQGSSKTVTIKKQEVSIGLTITDNGAGNAFVKRIKEGSVAAVNGTVSVGDMIRSINGENLIGAKHYEVARILKELPRYSTFTVDLIEPLKPFAVAPRNTTSKSGRPLSQLLEDSSSSEDGRGTLRLKNSGVASIEEKLSPWLSKVIEKVDDQLERFMGIRDSQLSHQLIDLSKGRETVSEFSTAINESGLRDFQFSDEFIKDIWTVIHDEAQ